MERTMVERCLREWAAEVRSPCEATLYLQRIPTDCSKASLRGLVGRAGFGDAYDYLYLPMCFHTRKSKGYAFINFVSEDAAELFIQRMDSYPMGDGAALSVIPSRTQGLGENMIIWARSQSRRVRNPDFLPYVRALDGLGMVHPSELWSRGRIDEPKLKAAGPDTWATGARASARAGSGGEPPEEQFKLEIGEIGCEGYETEFGRTDAGGFTSAVLAYGLANAVVLERFSV
ncbi:unnamed protein product [Prorocentrum cordatum]|uniref:RRM domain-containing protein n=1 Tax=Prorocentrum cordatum TaxID=2364126 RepID=A0ABN9SVT4_9DINO|nr:unnamed protein product [Polarella glacialis]